MDLTKIIGIKIAFFKKSDELPELFRLECLGNISFYQRNIGEAIKFYEAATLLSPEHVIPRYLYLAGVKNEREKNFVEAFKFYQAAIEAEPSFVDSYVELGGLLMKVGDFEGAMKCYEDALKLDSENPSNHENLKIVLTKLDKINLDFTKKKFKRQKMLINKLVATGRRILCLSIINGNDLKSIHVLEEVGYTIGCSRFAVLN